MREIIEAHSIERIYNKCGRILNQKNLPVLFFRSRRGSNILFLDDFNGVAVLNRLMGITHEQNASHYLRQWWEKWHK